MSNSSLVVEKIIAAPSARVWAALTDLKQMNQWYFPLKEFKPEVGFEFSFEGGPDDRKYLHTCKITEVIPGKKLAYTWKYETDPAVTHVSFELFPKGNNTLVRIIHEGLEKLDQSNPDFAKGNFQQGWDDIFGKLLPDFLMVN